MGDGPIKMVVHHNNLHKLSELHEVIKKALEVAAAQIGTKLVASAQLHIQAQDMRWTPLNSAYQAWKVKKGYSNQVYIMTSTYIQNVRWAYSKQDMVLIVGIMRDAPPHPDSGESLATIAEVLELGTLDGRIPARPLWAPMLLEHKRSIQTTIGICIAKQIKQFQAQFPKTPLP